MLRQTTQLLWLPPSCCRSLSSHYSLPAFLALLSSFTTFCPCPLLACFFAPNAWRGAEQGNSKGRGWLVTAGALKLVCNTQHSRVGGFRHVCGCYFLLKYLRVLLSRLCSGGSSHSQHRLRLPLCALPGKRVCVCASSCHISQAVRLAH